MRAKLLLVIGIFSFSLSIVWAQKVGTIYLPPKNSEMPSWFKVFYDEEKLAKVNVFQLDKVVLAYEKVNEKSRERELPESEILTGEENEDAYTNYYKRWRRAISRYVQEDGTIQVVENEEVSSNESALRPDSPTSTWSLLGPIETYWDASTAKAPWQSNIYAFAISPSNASIMYACPETGGIFRTADKGLNWDCKTINYNINTCTAIRVHPTNPDTVYAGRNNQLITTNDAGSTWNIKAMPWGDVQGIAFKPSNPTNIWVATNAGLYRKINKGSAINQNTVFNIDYLETTSPKWNCPTSSSSSCTASAGTNNYYHVFPFTVSAAGSYTFTMCTPNSNWDGYGSLYQNAFNGANPCAISANHLYSDDDANSGGNCNNDALMTVSLTTGTTYYLVTSSYYSNVTGNFQWTFTGPAGATLATTNDSWIQVPNMNTACYDIFFKTDDDNVAFCLKKNGSFTEFWRSTDGGQSFAASITGWTGKGITTDGGGRMTVTPADPNRIYAVLLGSAPSPDKPYIFRSNDAGLTWDTTATGVTGSPFFCCSTGYNLGLGNGQGYYDLDIVASPTDANQLLVGTTTAFRSTNGGASFSVVGGYMGSLGIHPDIQEMAASGSDCWISTDGGLNYSTDFFASAANFTPRFKGIFSSDMWGFAQGWNEDIVGGGRYHNGNTALSEAYTAGEAIRLGGGEAATGYYMIGRPRYIAFSDITPKIVPTTRNAALGSFTFTKFPNEDGYGNDMSEVEFLPYCYNTVYVGNGNDLWKSVNGGLTWTSLYTFAGRVKEFEISRSNPDVIYLATNAPTQLQKSTDGGASWTVLTLPAGASISRASLSLSYTDENTLWMVSPSNTSNNRVFQTTNGGTSWTNLTTATINGQAYTAIVHQNGTDNGVYIFGDNGKVFYRSDSEADWVAFSSGLPMVHNNEHILPFYRDSKIRSAGNQGIWQIDFYEEGAPVAQPMVDKLTSVCPRDTFYFEDYSALKHDGATWAWTFTGTSYVSSTSARNPKVLFSGIGVYDFSLTVSNAFGSSSKTITGKITITGNECSVDTIPGKMLTLTAAGDYAQQTSALNVTTNNITISAWIKPNGTQMGNAGIVFSASGGATGINFRSANQIGYHWEGQASTYNWAGGPTLPANEWSHVAWVVKDGVGTNDTSIIYLNGVPYQRVGTHNPVSFSSVFQFGIDRSNTARNFVGAIDEVCFYNRSLTKNEVRELMNLTRNNPNVGSMPSNDASLIAYYQFNESVTSPIYDKVSTRNLALVGAANKTQNSTAPVGGGRFHRLAVTNGGIKSFSNANLSLTFPATGTYPNGDLVVTRLNVPSDQPCANQVLPVNYGYWVIRNYGTNATFSALSAMTFKSIYGANNAMVTTPSLIELYKRTSNQDGNTWSALIDNADAVTNLAVPRADMTFSTGLSVTSFSQFGLGFGGGALPVQLLDFSARLAESQSVQLVWESTKEENLKGYEIQRSTNGTDFVQMGFAQAKGASKYTFLDVSPFLNKNYYRLKIIDLDGKFTYSKIEVIQIAGNQIIYLYPNPNNEGWFNLDISNAVAQKANVNITNTLGQKVMEFSIENLQTDNKHRFYLEAQVGVYLMTIAFDNGEVVKRKIVMEE